MKHQILLLLAAVVLLPFVVRPVIATEIWIFAIFGLGLNLLLGYTGLLSFGQSTFFGSAAYVAGWLLKHYGINVFFALGIGIGVGAPSAPLVGYLCVQRSGLYFIMLTFALNQLFYFVAYQWTSVTGGEDGMHGVPRPALLGIDFSDPLTYYVVRLAACSSCRFGSMKRIVESPLGKILQAIRENEVRAEAVGYNVPRFKLLAFVIGGAFSGLAGVLYAMLFGIVPLEAISFVFSGNVVFATLIGGSRLALRADHRLVRLHLALGVGERDVGALAAAPRRGVRDRGALLPRRRGRSVEPVLGMAGILETKNLSKSFGALAAVKDVSLSIAAGSLHSIIGPNGAGQDHALQPAHRHVPADLGTNPLRRKDITGTPANRVAHLGLARSFQRTNVFPAFSLLDNVWVAAFATGRSWNGLLFADKQMLPGGQRSALVRAIGCWARGQGQSAGARDLPRRAAPARARDRPRRRAARAAARRAGGRAFAGRDAQDGGAGARAQGALHDRADRAQDRHHHERLRPHLGDALRLADRGRLARRRSSATPRCAAPISAASPHDPELKKHQHVLRPGAHPARPVARRGRGRSRRAARPQRRGKDNHLALNHRPHAAASGRDPLQGPQHCRSDTHRVSRMGIALVPETRDIFSYLTARENLAIARRPSSRWQMDDGARALPPAEGAPGQQGAPAFGRRAADARHRPRPAHRPGLLLLDEPSQGLAPLVVDAVMSTIQELKKERVSMLLVEQNAEMALQLADRVYVIDHGTVVFEGTPERAARRPAGHDDLFGRRRLGAGVRRPARVRVLRSRSRAVFVRYERGDTFRKPANSATS